MIDSYKTKPVYTKQKRPLSQREGGFTLIEVMVALAILAVVAVAASRASSAYLSSVEVLRTRTLAHFVAQNAAADLRIQETWLKANKTQKITAQGRDWQIIMTVSDAITPALKEVNIAVAPVIDGQARNAVTDIDVMLSNPKQGVGSLDLSRLGKGDLDKSDLDKSDLDKSDLDKNDLDKNDLDKNDLGKSELGQIGGNP